MTKIMSVAVALFIAALGGWLWGAWGGSATARALQISELRGDLLGARAATLDARVAIYSVNFGEASGHLEDARSLLHRADERLKSLGRDDEIKNVETALTRIDDAQRLAGQLDQNANSRAGDAAKIVSNMLDVMATGGDPINARADRGGAGNAPP